MYSITHIIFFFIFLSAFNQNIESQNAPIYPNKSVIDIGNLKEQNETVFFTFSIKNRTDKIALISNIYSSCRCISVKASNFELQPFGEIIIEGYYNNAKHGEQLPQSIYISFSNPKKLIKIQVKGH